MTLNISLTLTITWAIVVLVWLAGSLHSKRTVQAQSAPSRLAHQLLVLIGYCLLAFNRFDVGWLAVRFVPGAHVWRAAGLVAAMLGAFIAIWARITLGANWSGRVTLKEHHTLIATGPYALVRHPIYSGLLLAIAGTAIVEGKLRCLLGFAFVLCAYGLKMRQEERLMMQTFPGDYPNYRRRVKALIPGFL